MVITGFLLFNVSVPVGAEVDGRIILPQAISETDLLTLAHNDDVVSFEFAGLHYFSPESNEYAYFMEGLDKDWNYVGNRRFATYTNLPFGNLRFRVKAANKDGVWNEEGVALDITVVPPYWHTVWFRSAIGLAAVLLMVSIYWLRVHQIEVRNRQLEEAVRERTIKLERALTEVKTLTGMLPICASCKRIRDDKGYWQQVEDFITERSQADFSHAICPDCVKKLYPELYPHIFNDPAAPTQGG
jgi:hypothetical protein